MRPFENSQLNSNLDKINQIENLKDIRQVNGRNSPVASCATPLLSFINQVSDYILLATSNLKINQDFSDLSQLLDSPPKTPDSEYSLDLPEFLDCNAPNFDCANFSIASPLLSTPPLTCSPELDIHHISPIESPIQSSSKVQKETR